jgi:hypothetical protein
MQTAKDIYEQSLRQLLPSLSNAEVKDVMKKNEDKMTIRFHTCLILIKDIECIVKDAIEMWKGIYHLHKPSDHPVEIKDDGSDEDNEENNDSLIVDVTDEDLQQLRDEEVDEEEKEEEAIEE